MPSLAGGTCFATLQHTCSAGGFTSREPMTDEQPHSHSPGPGMTGWANRGACSTLAPGSAGLSCGAYSGHLLGNTLFPVSRPHAPTSASWDPFPYRSLVLKSLSWGLLLREPKLKLASGAAD